MPGSPSEIIRFGPFELDLAKAELRKHGIRLRMQGQPFCILKALLENPGVTVSRDELVKRVWSAGTFVDFEHSLNTAITRLRQTLGDCPEKPRFIETVARRGYCFIGHVAGLSAVETPREGPPSETIALQSLVVLPFANLSPDRSDDYFSDGLAAEIINALTRISSLRVIARASSSLFHDRTLPLKEVAARLKVDALLDGSFRRSGNRMRVTAQLVHGSDENCLWSEQYDRELTDVVDVQEEIAQSIVRTLKLTVGGERLIRRGELTKWPPDGLPSSSPPIYNSLGVLLQFQASE